MTDTHDPLTCELCHAEGTGAEIGNLRAVLERIADDLEAELAVGGQLPTLHPEEIRAALRDTA